MLRELLAHGVTPDFIVGSSAGAVNAAYFAGSPRPISRAWHGWKPCGADCGGAKSFR